MTEASNQIVGGRYEVVREIARGGMGVVYEARHRMTKKAVALKVLFPHIGKDPGARQRFLREVSAPAQIGHPGIVEVYDADFDASDGSLFVARTRDGGQTWEQLRNGLPQEAAWDVVYRHALASSAGRVAFGSTTGNLYLSEDGGDSWITLGNNLPPIYSVRFA